MKRLFFVLCGVVLFLVKAGLGGEGLVFDFESPSVLRDFRAYQTAGRGRPALWEVRSGEAYHGRGYVLVLPDPRTNRGSCFNVLLLEGKRFRDVEVAVAVRPFKGREDQGGGPVWRALDADNYYVVRWNPLEDNFRLYYVKDGRRRMLTSAGLKADPSRWHLIRVVHRGEEIRAYFDGKLYLRYRDRTFTAAGRVGLWTKADAATAFDLLKVREIR